MGLYSKSEPLHRRSLAIKEKVLGAEHPFTAGSLQNLGNLHMVIGAYAKAEVFYQRALAIKEKVLGPQHPSTAEALVGLALAYQETGAYSKSVTLLQRAIAIREKATGGEDQPMVHMFGNLAISLASSGDYAGAQQFYERALAMAERVLGPQHPDTATALQNTAEHYSFRGEHQKAVPLMLRSLEITEKVYGPQHPDFADTLANLATMYREVGDYAKSAALYRRALAIFEKNVGPRHPSTGNLLLRVGVLNWASGNTAKGLVLLQRSQAIAATGIDRFLVSGSETRKQAYLEALSEQVFMNATFSVAVPGSGSAALGLTSLLQHKGRALDAVSESVNRLRQSVRASDRAVFEELEQVAQQLSILTYQGAAGLSSDAYRARLDELTRQQELLETRLAKNSNEFRGQLVPATLASVRAALPADAALVEWLRYKPYDPKARSEQQRWGAPRYVAYVLRRTGDPVVVDLGDAGEIETLVGEFRLAVSDSGRTDVKRQAESLSNRIITPLRPHLGSARHLLLSPDGALNLVPMAALLDERRRYLAERFEITYLTSGRDLLRVAAREDAPSSNAVLIADPDYGRRIPLAQAGPASPPPQERSAELDRGGGLAFRPLPGTVLEVGEISDLLHAGGVRVLEGEQASEMNLKRVHGPWILHLATHGFFLSDQELKRVASSGATDIAGEVIIENPLLRSGLALAGANQRRSGMSDDGILTALEASRLDLRGTELVVLSACETGVGEVRNGSGIAGLRRGLLLAGAQTQVASLWKVADLPTKELMVSFYKYLVQGEGRSAALRRAQREMLLRPGQSHPYYWAGFVAIGDWRPLSARLPRSP